MELDGLHCLDGSTALDFFFLIIFMTLGWSQLGTKSLLHAWMVWYEWVGGMIHLCVGFLELEAPRGAFLIIRLIRCFCTSLFAFLIFELNLSRVISCVDSVYGLMMPYVNDK